MINVDSLALSLSRAPADVLRLLALAQLTHKELEQHARSAAHSEPRLLLQELAGAVKESEGLSPVIQGIALGLLASGPRGTTQLVSSAPIPTHTRETAGVLASLIAGSHRTLCFCTYIIAFIDEVLALLQKAEQRGVDIRGIVDGSNLATDSGSRALSLLRATIPSAEIYVWKPASRTSTLHAKFLVADQRSVLVTSANLTGRAITDNVEAGLLIEDEGIAQSLEQFVGSLISSEYSTALDSVPIQS